MRVGKGRERKREWKREGEKEGEREKLGLDENGWRSKKV